jgi:hypothetical protein
MKKYIQLTFASLVIVLGLAVVPAQSTSAIDVFSGACKDSAGGGTTTEGETGGGNESGGGATEGGDGAAAGGGSGTICGSTGEQAEDIIKNVVNTILVVLGMAAVIMIIIGGIRYTVSNGDASSIKGAKDTILYAVIGLIVAILAYAIVNFVLGRFS